jgi:hypothetical protein
MLVRIAVSAATLALTLAASPAQAQMMQLTPTIALGTLDQAAADPAFETKTLAELQGLRAGAAQGETSFLLRKDRGPHTGRYAVFVTSPGAGRTAAYARVFPKVVQYTLIGANQVGALPTVDVLGVHYIKVKPGQGAAFEKFTTDKMNAAVANLRPDLRFLNYKGTDGSYFTIIALTKSSRDKYWPNGADSDVLKEAFTPAVRALADELKPFLVDGSWGVNMVAQVYEAKEWADWFVVAPPAR